MEKVKILEQTLKNPISFMGQCAGIAYNSDASDPEKNYKRGLSCVKDGHYRMLEFCDIYFELNGYSIRCIREFARHVADGLTMIQRSTRYCNESNSSYFVPFKIKNNPDLVKKYNIIMNNAIDGYNDLLEAGVTKEDAANVLPLGLDTVLAVKHNARTMMTMAEQRLCFRTYSEYRELMKEFISALENYSPEWEILCNLIMKCKCEKVGWCEEHMTCGKYPKKENIKIVEIDK